ncbi:MAG: hypothetical protein MO846_11385 [Candidatus Devosia symbiotica]|nr:hypothetical protein [Candidatus Devosia symbiotica]
MFLPLTALFLAAFASGTAEFVIAGVLPEMATDLGITIPIAGYTIGIAIGGPIVAVTTKKFLANR